MGREGVCREGRGIWRERDGRKGCGKGWEGREGEGVRKDEGPEKVWREKRREGWGCGDGGSES